MGRGVKGEKRKGEKSGGRENEGRRGSCLTNKKFVPAPRVKMLILFQHNFQLRMHH